MSEIDIASEAARCAGHSLKEHFNQPHQVSYKGIIDLVTEMDKESERLITGMLSQSFPEYGFLGEEGSNSTATYACRWIIDPLDGTTNYTFGYPLFAVSIALEKQGQITLGVVYNPILDELFTAERGTGAYLNGAPIHVTRTTKLGKSLLASGFPYDVWSNPRNNCSEWEQFIKKTISVRCDGSAALDLCHVACGRLDGYWELDLEPWDMAAGALIVQEAGGIVTQVDGTPFDHMQHNVLASNGHLHQVMLDGLKR
ncbi:MAG: inositol monophosphatase [Chloroflexi bacterium RBG_13_48_10]|nr:MAG: inositol monophosphatase [Chloroflexi bacterium RBG_13_48_10]